MNNKYGADNALSYAQIVMSLAGSLISPRLTTRKLVSDVLTFLCHWENGRGHEKVLNALDHLKSQQGETGRFDGWMRLVEVTVDGRGKMGSLVGASDEVRSGGIGMENLLMEYAVASMIFVNMLIDTPQNDLKLRCHIRAQFISCGIYRILTKMESFQYEMLDTQIESFRSNEAIDYEDLLERDDASMAEGIEGEGRDMSDPVHIAETIRNKIGNSDAYNPFVSSMQHMLVMLHQNDAGESGRVYKLVDAMLNYVATDRRLPDMDLKQSLNLTVQNVLDRLYTDSEARQATEDALSARQIADAAIAERDDTRADMKLGADGLVGKLQKQVEEQQGVIHLMNRHVDALKAEVAELQRLRAQELQRNELETRELYLMLRDAQDYAASAAKKNTNKSGGPVLEPKEMQGILDREKLMGRLETQLERAKTRAKLEGKVWQQVTPSDRLRELREQMDGQLGQTEEELRKFEANYDQTFLGSVRASRGGPGGGKVTRKAVPGTLPSDVLDEGDEEDVVFEQAKMVDVSRPHKMPAALLGEIAARVAKDDGSDEEGGIPDGVTTGTTHPSIEAESPKTPADEKFDAGSDKTAEAPASTLPGFTSRAPPPPPLPSNLDGAPGLAGFTSNAPPPPPPPPGMPGAPGLPAPPPPPLPGGKRGPGFLPRGSLPSAAPVPALGVARPKKKMKALHWEKVDTPQVTVWATHAPSLDDREERYRELSRKGVLDEVERLFLAKETKKFGQSSTKNDKKSIISSDVSKNFRKIILDALRSFLALD
jgi:cytokinesis protein